jgi:hypothetical protein
MHRSMLLVLVAAICAACHRPATTYRSLPPEWPLPQLTVPRDAKVVWTDVSDQKVMVSYTSDSDWRAEFSRVEGQLRPMDYRVSPQSELPTLSGQHRGWSSPNRTVGVLLHEMPVVPSEVKRRTGQSHEFELLASKPDPPFQARAWPRIK